MISFLRFFLRLLPDKLYLQLMFFKHHHRFINFEKPTTFNEKIQYLKLYNRKSEYTEMVDKYLVKKYVADKIGNEYVIPTLGSWNCVNDIVFEKLPNQFVLKWNHDSGSIVICRDKKNFDVENAKKKLLGGEISNGFWYGREWPYKNVIPKLIAEPYLSDDAKSDSLTDYKIHCFNGIPKVFLVCQNRFTTGLVDDFYDVDWNLLAVHRPFAKQSAFSMQKPATLEQMLEFAKILSANLPFARIDFYEVSGKLYFGEITLYPASGFLPFVPREWDEKFGDMLNVI